MPRAQRMPPRPTSWHSSERIWWVEMSWIEPATPRATSICKQHAGRQFSKATSHVCIMCIRALVFVILVCPDMFFYVLVTSHILPPFWLPVASDNIWESLSSGLEGRRFPSWLAADAQRESKPSSTFIPYQQGLNTKQNTSMTTNLHFLGLA
jgi:hypothetical protein